jgi:hypothetical protein
MSRTTLNFALLALLAPGCGSATTASSTTAIARGVEAPTPTLEAAPESDVFELHLVGRIHSLLDLVPTEDGIELRVGTDPGGGMLGEYSYVPLVGFAPDLERASEPVSYANTSSFPLVEMVGARPELVRHVISAFRSASSEHYTTLDSEGRWQTSPLNGREDFGAGILRWSEGRLLELRLPQPETRYELESMAPEFRVVRGPDEPVPTIPKVLSGRLAREGFRTETFRAFESGEVIVVGLTNAPGLASLYWSKKLDAPTYSAGGVPLEPDEELRWMGGDTLATLRLITSMRVLRFERDRFVLDSTVEEGELPDLWFDRTTVVWNERGCFVRLREDGAWHVVPTHDPDASLTSCFTDREGTVWVSEGDAIYASKRPPSSFAITEAELTRRRERALGSKVTVD